MWNKPIFFAFFLLSSFGFSQVEDVNDFSGNKRDIRVGLSMNLSLIPQRTLTFPTEAIDDIFYREHFGIVETPEKINRGISSFQIGGNGAYILYSKNRRVEFEFGLDFGFQTAGIVTDKISKRVTDFDTSYVTAEIEVEYKLRELYGSGYALIKSNNNFIDVYIGLGTSFYGSIGSAIVTNYWQGNQLNSYDTRIPTYTNFTAFVPFGIEFPLSRKSPDFYLKLMASISRERHKYNFQPIRFFLSGGFQLQYQF